MSHVAGLTFAQLGEAIGRDEVWVAALFYGQVSLAFGFLLSRCAAPQVTDYIVLPWGAGQTDAGGTRETRSEVGIHDVQPFGESPPCFSPPARVDFTTHDLKESL